MPRSRRQLTTGARVRGGGGAVAQAPLLLQGSHFRRSSWVLKWGGEDGDGGGGGVGLGGGGGVGRPFFPFFLFLSSVVVATLSLRL